MIERTLLYPVHVANLLSIRDDIYTYVGALEAEGLMSSEPVNFKETDKYIFKKMASGQEWGGLFDCCWFRLKGRVPESAKGKHVVLIINVEGEGLVYDMTAGGKPMQGITQIMTGIDAVQSLKGKQVVEFLNPAEGGEEIDVMVDAGYNNIHRKNFRSKLARKEIAVKNDDVFRYYYDYLELFQLMLTVSKNDNIDSNEVKKISRLLLSSYRLRKKDVVKAAEMLEKRINTPNDKEVNEYTAVGHAHLDLAWLWPIRETKRKAARTFATALKNIELYPDYVFGASQAQQFEWMEEGYPDIYEKIKKAVADDRIEIQGGMWTESDCNLPTGESLIRQFMYGDKYFGEKFGKHTDMVWLPDVFGFPASLPQIMKKCGKKYFMTIKLSWNEHNKFPYKTFVWKGIDGSEIISHMPPQGDYNSSGCALAVAKSDFKNEQKKEFKEALISFGAGDGGGGPGEGHLECISREKDMKGLSKVRFGAARDFFQRLSADRDKMPVYDGELYLEKHQGTYTSQARNKKYNRLMERVLHNYEWLSSIAQLRGIPYNKALLDKVWKEVLLYQFHDIIPGSSIERVYKETTENYEKMYDQITGASDSLLSVMSKGEGLHVLNGTYAPVDKYFKYEDKWYHAKVGGYSSAPIEECESDGEGLAIGEDEIENDILKLKVRSDGSICSLVDKRTGKEYAKDYLNKLVIYSDPRMYYNAWDIKINYPSLKKYKLTVKSVKTYIDGFKAVLKVSYYTNKSVVVQRMSLTKGEDVLRIDTYADWHEKHKMLRADFDPTVWSDTVECDIQFGNIKRSTGNQTSVDKARFEICAHKYLTLEDGENGFAVLNDCKYGYRVKEGIISVNLLRSPKFPDKNCDMGKHEFSYAVCPYEGTAKTAGIVRKAYLLNNPLFVTGSNVDIRPLIKVSGDNVVLETVKPAENGKGIVARLYERYGEESTCTVEADFDYKSVYNADMLESKHDLIGKELTFGPFEIKTLYFEF